MNRERYKTRIRREAKISAHTACIAAPKRTRPAVVPEPESDESRNIRKIHVWLRLGRGRNYIAAVPRDMREIIARMLIDCKIEHHGSETSEQYTMFGVLHNPYGPAVVDRGFVYSAVYYSYGVVHRNYGPATIYRSPTVVRLTWLVRGMPKRPHGWPTSVEWYHGMCDATWMPENRIIQMKYNPERLSWDEILTDGNTRTVTDAMTGQVRHVGTGGIFQMIPGG